MLRPALLPALLAPALLAPACTGLGERATTGDCPAGAVCSPATPVGLAFNGLSLADQFFGSGLHPTAVGGHQPITVINAATDRPLQLPYLARIYDDAFTATQSGSVVTLGAVAAGAARLSIFEPGGALYDRIAIEAQEVRRLDLVADRTTLDPARGVALAAGVTTDLAIALHGTGTSRLIDAGLTITSTGAAADQASGWDARTITAGATGPITLTATTSAGTELVVTMAVAATADQVVLQPRAPLVVNQAEEVCASALAGPDQLVGLIWRWSTTDPATLVSTWTDNCVGIIATQAGDLTLTATAGNRTTTLVVPVVASAKAVPAERSPEPETSGLGERARLVAGE